MKPPAPTLTGKSPQPTLQTEIDRVCEAKATDRRVTVPSPPSEEALRAATPLPPEPTTEPPNSAHETPTTPAPPMPSQIVASEDERPSQRLRAAIPPPPRMPRIA